MIERIFAFLLILICGYRLIVNQSLVASNLLALVDLVLKPVVVLIFIISSSSARTTRYNFKVMLGVLLSYLSPLALKVADIQWNVNVYIAAIAAMFFYFFAWLISMVTVGKSFGVFPAYREIVVDGMYKIVKHPIYSCYIHLFTVYFLLFPGFINLIGLLMLYVGLKIRAKEEEVVLSENSNYQMYMKNKHNFFSFWLSSPVLFLIFVISFLYFMGSRPVFGKTNQIKVQLAYPVLSLSPMIYDDWSSVFVGNHIYPRLSPDKERPWVASITDNLNINCLDKKLKIFDKKCSNLEVRFKLNTIKSCRGGHLSFQSIREEFFAALSKKNWILPGWKKCDSSENEVCVVAKNVKDVERRLKNLYFRFGYTQNEDVKSKKSKFGAGSYCLTNIDEKDGNIVSGTLVPLAAESSFPEIYFFTSTNKNDEFNFALYGTKDLLRGDRKNAQTHTPLAYYMVTNKKWAGKKMPWNTIEAKKILVSEFSKNEIVYSEVPSSIESLVPSGSAIETSKTEVKRITIQEGVSVVLPDYLPNCKEISQKLAKTWNDTISVNCTDTTIFIDKKIRLKDPDWDAFISPLSPGAPGKMSIAYQYFSADSNESWTLDYPQPEKLYYLIGLGQSLVTIDGKRICDIKPNSLGLGDLVISDLVSCVEGK